VNVVNLVSLGSFKDTDPDRFEQHVLSYMTWYPGDALEACIAERTAHILLGGTGSDWVLEVATEALRRKREHHRR
jgi:hypothetical protein